MTQLAENLSKEFVSVAVQKIKNAVETDKNLSVGLVHNIKEIGKQNKCPRVFSVTMEIIVSVPIGIPDSADEVEQTIIFEQPTEYFEVAAKQKEGYFGLPSAGFRIPLKHQESYKSPLELTIRRAEQFFGSKPSSNE